MSGDLPEVPLMVNTLELGFLVHAVWERSRHGDVLARSLFRKVKAAAIASGVKWVYGEPWVEAPAKNEK